LTHHSKLLLLAQKMITLRISGILRNQVA